MKKIMADYFSFSKRERVAVLIILVIAVGFIAMPYFFGVKKKARANNEQLQEQINALQSNKPKTYTPSRDGDESSQPQTATAVSPTKVELFQFDPNTLDEAGWIRLGIREKTAKTIIKYCSKGGKFKTPEDIRKIWGLRKEDADRIIPYIVIKSTNGEPSYKNGFQKPATGKPSLLDANTATAYQLKTLPGIGNSLPYKIVNYREKLGGFLNMLQVKETYGMTDSIFAAILPYLHVLPTTIRKININTATDIELNAHPYIDKASAKSIIFYRTKNGNFKSVDDVKKISFISNDLFNKIASYLTTE